MTPKNQKVKPFARVNTRIREDQKKFVKEAKRKNLTEGELFRLMIDFFIKKK